MHFFSQIRICITRFIVVQEYDQNYKITLIFKFCTLKDVCNYEDILLSVFYLRDIAR